MLNEADYIMKYVTGRIAMLRSSSNEAAVRAKLANLRRGIGRAPGSMPELWDMTLEGLESDFMSKDGVPTRGEWAIYAALTLFALHQQGKDIKNEPMNVENAQLGASVKRLVRPEEEDSRVKRRFDAAVTAESMDELIYHLRGLVQLLKSESIPLDYGALAADIYRFQFAGLRDRVRLKWGQDFHRRKMADAASTQNNAESERKG